VTRPKRRTSTYHAIYDRFEPPSLKAKNRPKKTAAEVKSIAIVNARGMKVFWCPLTYQSTKAYWSTRKRRDAIRIRLRLRKQAGT
jgi:hypothetical protein